MRITRSQILAHLDSSNGLPVLPQSVATLIALQDDPGSGVRDAIQVVRTDPGMAAQVLKMANSAARGIFQPFTSLDAAGAHLGLSAIVEIAMVQAMTGMFTTRRLGLHAPGLWRRSVAIGRLAQTLREMLATRLPPPLPSPADCFTAGLLHDVGILVLLNGFPEEVGEVIAGARERGQPLLEEEREALTIDHQEIGALACQRWSLSEPVREAAAHHHQPGQVQGPHRTLVELVHVANHIAINRGFGYDGEVTAPSIAASAWDNLSLDLQQAGEIISRAEAAALDAGLLI